MAKGDQRSSKTCGEIVWKPQSSCSYPTGILLRSYSKSCAVIHLAADIAHAGVFITHLKHLSTAGLVEIAALRLALLNASRNLVCFLALGA